MMSYYTQPLARLIEEFQKLPGVGPKSAQRIAFHIIRQSNTAVEQFASALIDAKEKVNFCEQCFNHSTTPLCEICLDKDRQTSQLCVVAEPKDLYALERTHEYRGFYHVLQGLISPLEGIGPDDLKLRALLRRLEDTTLTEVILALPPSVEGDTTSLYIARLLKPIEIKLTRIAFGLPVGSELEYADSVTLSRAMQGRQAV
ncbi:MAG: recombination mediator RecR [Cyanobacteria bacterium P01_H01_bin.74]